MNRRNLLICVLLVAFQAVIGQGYESHNSISFNNLNDGRDLPDGITWFQPDALTYGIYRTKGPWLAPNYQQLMLAYETGIIIDGGSLYGKSGTFLQPNNGNVGIGTLNPKNKLDVNGTIHSREVKVDMDGWSDFVFEKDYALPTLEEVEKHIAEKGHLENIPSEKEVLENGINLGEMNRKLLQKIEELTLYAIEQDRENKKQSLKIEMLEKENEVFEELFSRLSKIEEKLK